METIIHYRVFQPVTTSQERVENVSSKRRRYFALFGVFKREGIRWDGLIPRENLPKRARLGRLAMFVDVFVECFFQAETDLALLIDADAFHQHFIAFLDDIGHRAYTGFRKFADMAQAVGPGMISINAPKSTTRTTVPT